MYNLNFYSSFRKNRGLLFSAPGIKIESFTNKHTTMKKLLLVLAIGSFAACNGSSSEAKVDSTASAAKDSISSVADSAKKVIDSTATAGKDSVKAAVDSAKK
jgi:uncharacterized lipoprotein YajG